MAVGWDVAFERHYTRSPISAWFGGRLRPQSGWKSTLVNSRPWGCKPLPWEVGNPARTDTIHRKLRHVEYISLVKKGRPSSVLPTDITCNRWLPKTRHWVRRIVGAQNRCGQNRVVLLERYVEVRLRSTPARDRPRQHLQTRVQV